MVSPAPAKAGVGDTPSPAPIVTLGPLPKAKVGYELPPEFGITHGGFGKKPHGFKTTFGG